MGQFDLAIKDYTEAIKLDPNDDGSYLNKPNYYLVRGNIYFHLGKHDLTKSDMEKIISMNPDDATLGIAQKILGQIN